jgi:hypothetical protein
MRHPECEENRIMWKLVVGFVVFAAIVLFVLSKAGGDVDMGGEKHGVDAHDAAPPASAPASGG